MQFSTCEIPGLIVINPSVFEDSRGYFYEAYNQMIFHSNGITCNFVQDNQSRSAYGVIRGLHYQLPPFAQSKLVRVLEGEILDVAVDIRKDSPTYGQYFSLHISAKNKLQLFIPPGFAHGFSVLSDIAVVLYKCDAFYNKQSEGGILFNDEAIKINWGIPQADIIISDKDRNLPTLKESINNFRHHT